VSHVHLPIHGVHGPRNCGALEILLLEIDSNTLLVAQARTIEHIRCPQIVTEVEKAQLHRKLRLGRLANLSGPTANIYIPTEKNIADERAGIIWELFRVV